jgi:hypothetical protein
MYSEYWIPIVRDRDNLHPIIGSQGPYFLRTKHRVPPAHFLYRFRGKGHPPSHHRIRVPRRTHDPLLRPAPPASKDTHGRTRIRVHTINTVAGNSGQRHPPPATPPGACGVPVHVRVQRDVEAQPVPAVGVARVVRVDPQRGGRAGRRGDCDVVERLGMRRMRRSGRYGGRRRGGSVRGLEMQRVQVCDEGELWIHGEAVGRRKEVL